MRYAYRSTLVDYFPDHEQPKPDHRRNIRKKQRDDGTLALLHRCGSAIEEQRIVRAHGNHEQQTAFAASVAAQVSGDERVDANTPPVMGGEDFSFMLEARPGAFIFIGNGDTAGLHHPAYDFNDAAIPAGISFWARLVETALPK